MDNFPRQKLCEIITQYGKTIYEDRQRLENLLCDMCGEYRREINVLISALKERVPEDLLSAPEGVPLSVLLVQLSRRLQDNLGVTDEAARWAVESWAVCLGFAVPSFPAKTTPPIATFTITLPTTNFTAQLSKITRPYIDQIRLAWALMVDARMPIVRKLIPILGLAYLVSPVSLFVGLVPLIGPLADLAVFMLALVLFISSAPADLVTEHKKRIHTAGSETKITAMDQPPVETTSDHPPADSSDHIDQGDKP